MEQRDSSMAETSAMLRMGSVNTANRSVDNLSIPDMSASLSAKVSVSHEEQSAPHLLAKVYDNMAAKFFDHGLNLDAVAATGQYFNNLDGHGHAVPLDYSAFPAPLPDYSVRLGVIFFQESNRILAELVHSAALEIMGLLPPGTKIHLNNQSHYHITIFMTSQPHTLRPNPFDPSAVIPADIPPEQLYQTARPKEDVLQQEVAVMAAHTAAMPPPSLAVHRLLLADSGTLLLCNVDSTGRVAELRKRLGGAYPGAPPRQPTILHASIARVLSPVQFDPEVKARVQEACDRWTERLAGMRFDPEAIWHVAEKTFTTVEGPRVRLPFKTAG